MDETDRMRLDYDQTAQLLRSLTDTRFRLLAFVPTVAGAAVGLISGPRSGLQLLAIGTLGLTATLGILLYELRNSQITRSAAARARRLEGHLLLEGPLVVEWPEQGQRLFGVVAVWHGRGVALV